MWFIYVMIFKPVIPYSNASSMGRMEVDCFNRGIVILRARPDGISIEESLYS